GNGRNPAFAGRRNGNGFLRRDTSDLRAIGQTGRQKARGVFRCRRQAHHHAADAASTATRGTKDRTPCRNKVSKATGTGTDSYGRPRAFSRPYFAAGGQNFRS